MASEQDEVTYCPKCGYEYEHWVEICPDCGEALETRAAESTQAEEAPLDYGEPGPQELPPYYQEPKPGKMPLDYDPRWVAVTNVPNAIIGNFLKSQLENAGIPVLMMRSSGADIAQFSHNDFVPQDLLVPQDRFHDARRMIDSPPGDIYGPDIYDPADYPDNGPDSDTFNWPGSEQQAAPPPSDVPEGWQMLPTEADLAARQEVRRSHGEVLRGWYWADEPDQGHADHDAGRQRGPWHDDYDMENEPGYHRVGSGPFGYGAGDDYYSDRNKWIRIVYAVLILAMSLPFILQVFGQIASVITRFP